MKYVSLDKLSRFKDKLLEILMLKSTYDNDSDGQVEKADLADSATKLATARTITIGRQSLTFDGTANKTFSPESIYGVYFIASTVDASYTNKYAQIGTFTVTGIYQNFYAVLQLYDVESGTFGGLLYIRLRSGSTTTTNSYPIVTWLGMTPNGEYVDRVYITQDSSNKAKYYVYIKLSAYNYRTINYRVLINVGSINFSNVGSSAFTDSMTGTTVATSSVAFSLSNHTHSNATTSASGFMSASDKKKLDDLSSSGGSYELPIASSSKLGGIKIGEGLTIESSSGVCSLNMQTTQVTLDVANWSQQSDGSYTQTVTVSNITSSQSPIIDLDTNGKTLETIATYEEEWAKVVDAQSNDGSITFKAKEQINASFSAVVKSSLGTVNDGYTSTVQEVTLSASGWSNNAQTVTLTGMTALKYPIVDVKINTTVIADIQSIQSQFGKIIHGVTGTNQITFYCSDVPTIDLTILVKEI